jgi:cell wall-associated NlpC family hydrolase
VNSDNAMVSEALNYLGIRYRFGGASPDTGFDCSGLVTYTAERSLGLKLPRSAAEMAQQGISVSKNELKAGDLVFFNTLGRRYSHVGIYLGDDRFVHSPSSGGVVRVENMAMTYWTKRYNGARRLDNSLMASARAAN